jgi:hypothetical protein
MFFEKFNEIGWSFYQWHICKCIWNNLRLIKRRLTWHISFCKKKFVMWNQLTVPKVSDLGCAKENLNKCKHVRSYFCKLDIYFCLCIFTISVTIITSNVISDCNSLIISCAIWNWNKYAKMVNYWLSLLDKMCCRVLCSCVSP